MKGSPDFSSSLLQPMTGDLLALERSLYTGTDISFLSLPALVPGKLNLLLL